jgi:hypothetical protein
LRPSILSIQQRLIDRRVFESAQKRSSPTIIYDDIVTVRATNAPQIPLAGLAYGLLGRRCKVVML